MSIMVDEIRALEHNPSFYNASAPGPKSKKKKGLLKKGGAALGAFLFLAAGIIVFFFSAGEFVPDLIKTNLVEATDIQCANGTIDKEWAFIETLRQGSAPSDTVANLKNSGYQIGYLNENNEFVEDPHGTLLKSGDKFLSGDKLFDAFQSDTKLYKAFNEATYSCAAFYYDDAANQTFKDLGANRNSSYIEGGFKDTLDKTVEGTSDINFNSVSKTTKQVTDENGQTKTVVVYEATGDSATTKDASAEELVDSVRNKNAAATTTEAALNTADALKVADTMTKEQRSSRLFVYFMENIDKMKAGEGNDSYIHDVMSFLTTSHSSEVVDTETGEVVTKNGSPMDSPALNAVLSGKPIKVADSKNYSSDRILKTVENQLNLNTATIQTVQNPIAQAIESTVSSFSNSTGVVARFLSSGLQTVELSVLAPIIPTISSSLIKNQVSIYGITAGEMLVEGAVNVGRKLAMNGSGATASDDSAVISYYNQIRQIATLNSAAESLDLSPFDITNKNTFFGSIAYQLIPVITKTSSLTSLVTSAIASLTPNTYAEDNINSLLTSFGDCETYATIGAVGTAHCSLIASFDTSTQHDPYNNSDYLNFVEQNTYLDESGNRQVKKDSYLADFIIYNNNRISPFGTTDGGVLSGIKSGSDVLRALSDPSTLISLFNESSEEDKAIATGAAFVNSSSNPYWNNYKYAQRYVSINRAVSILKAYSTDQTAYQSLPGCEGTINSVLAFTEEYYKEHPKTTYTSLATIDKKEASAPQKSQEELTTKPLNTRNNNLVVAEVLNQTLAPRLVKLREYIIKQNNWALA